MRTLPIACRDVGNHFPLIIPACDIGFMESTLMKNIAKGQNPPPHRIEVGHLPDWPPLPPCKEMDEDNYEGVFVGSEFVVKTPQHDAHLLINIRRDGVNYRAVYRHPSEKVLHRLEATLRGKEGVPLKETRRLALVEVS